MTYAIAAALQKAVFERLQADAILTGLVGTAIYDAIPPGILGGTYVSLGTEDVRDASDDTGYGAWHEITISVVTDESGFAGAKAVATAISDALVDAPLSGDDGDSWLLEEVQGDFTLVGFGDLLLPEVEGVRRIGVNQRADYPCFVATNNHAVRRYGTGKAYLFRPDGHVCAVFDRPDASAVAAARDRAACTMQEDDA